MRFGILGTARIARRIVADMQSIDSISVAAIASRDASRAQWYADQYGIARAFGDYQQMLDSDEIDAVYVPLPPSLHAQWACKAITAGKHVLVEKPVETNVPDAMAIHQKAEERGVIWMDATAWLHHSRTARIREHLNSGTLGNLRHISVACSFFEPFQSNDHRLSPALGGGCLLDLGWYAHGVARFAAGEMPSSVQAIGRRRPSVASEDEPSDVWYRVSSLLEFPSGATATVNCAYDTATRKWMEIAGDEASIVCDDFTRPWPQKPARFWIHDRAGTVTSEEFTGNQESEMLKQFVAAANGEFDSAPLQQQALDTQQLCASVEAKLR